MAHSRNIEVTAEEVTQLLGDIDAETLLAILALHPDFADVEEAAVRVSGNGEAVGGKQASGKVAAILDLLGENEDPESP